MRKFKEHESITIVDRPRYILFRSSNLNTATYYRTKKSAEKDMQEVIDNHPGADIYFSLLDTDRHSIEIYQANALNMIYHVRQDRLIPLMNGV